MPYNEELSQRIQDCRELYLKHGGEHHELIEQEMRAMGHTDFHRRSLYRRFERGTCKPGWIETYGWNSLLRYQQEKQKAATKNSPPYEGGVDAALGGRGGSLAAEIAHAGVEENAENHPVGETPTPLLRKEGSLLAESPASIPLPDFDEFKNWLTRTWPKMEWEWRHLVYIYKRLKRVWDGDCKR